MLTLTQPVENRPTPPPPTFEECLEARRAIGVVMTRLHDRYMHDSSGPEMNVTTVSGASQGLLRDALVVACRALEVLTKEALERERPERRSA